MSYTHTHLPELDILKEIIKTNPTQIKYYSKYSSFIGSTESITTKPREIKKEFDSKYNSPAMKLLLEEQGWKYIGNNNDNPIYQLIY